MYQRILVATGGSPWSDAAVAYAIALAARTGAELRIVTVLTLGTTFEPDVMVPHDLMTAIIESEGEARLAQAAAQASRAGVGYTTLGRWGHVPHTILDIATAEGCDLIILGSRGLIGWKRLMLGSISNTVAAKAAQPVLVVKRPPPVASGAPLWRRVLVATGGSAWSDAAVEYAVRLAHAQQFELCFLHVERARSSQGNGPAPAEGKAILVLAEARAAAAGLVYDATLASGDIARSILETAATKQCDAIIVGSRGLTGWRRLMLGSIASSVAAKADLPVLIVKRFGEA